MSAESALRELSDLHSLATATDLFRDARKARRPNRGPGASRGPGLVKGEASHLSGRQTEYRRKAGRRVNVDMGEKGARLDGQRGKLTCFYSSYLQLMSRYAEITKIDREARKAFVDEQVERLRGEGMPATRAKARAVEIFDDTNPWYKTGNTRGKVCVLDSSVSSWLILKPVQNRRRALPFLCAAHGIDSISAAELRAAAAERRLASLTPKAENTEPESDSDHQDDSGSDDTEHQVDDPHLDADARRKEMEDEMNEDEMEGLRGGWEDFISERVGAGGTVITPSSAHPSPPQSGPSKRRASPEITPPAKKPATAKTIPSMFAPRLGANIVREERLRALGMISTTSARAGKSLGGPLTANVKAEVNDGVETDNRDIHPRDDGRPGWKCRQCTFINLMDHGRCGQYCQTPNLSKLISM